MVRLVVGYCWVDGGVAAGVAGQLRLSDSTGARGPCTSPAGLVEVMGGQQGYAAVDVAHPVNELPRRGVRTDVRMRLATKWLQICPLCKPHCKTIRATSRTLVASSVIKPMVRFEPTTPALRKSPGGGLVFAVTA